MDATTAHSKSISRSHSASAVVDGVILDVDGTLVDSNDAHAHAWVEAFSAHGVEAPYQRVRRLIGKGGDKLLAEVAGIDHESALGRAIEETRRTIFIERYAPHLKPCPGARALLQRLREDGLRLAVATSAKAAELQVLLQRAEVADLIDTATSSDDAERSKPDPDIVVAALRRARLEVHRAVMIGDTPYDVEAATRVGLRIVGLRSGGWSDDDLRGAVAIYDHPLDLLRHYAEFLDVLSRTSRAAARGS
ncbi:MAG: HAD family hydrolase [Candidatus Binatia bacterium]